MSQYRVLCPETADTSSVSEFSVATMMNRIIASNSVLSCSADVWGRGRELHGDHKPKQKLVNALRPIIMAHLDKFNRHLVKEIK